MKIYTLLIIALFLITACSPTDVEPEVTDELPDDTTVDNASDSTNTSDDLADDTADDITDDTADGTTDDTGDDTDLADDTADDITDDTSDDTTDENETEVDINDGYHIVSMKDLKFDPKDIIIAKGDTVSWVHEDDYSDNENLVHILQIYGPEPSGGNSGRMLIGDTFDKTFNVPGSYWYIDVIFSAQMRGTINVTE
jgi:plastocyanin